MSLQELIGRAPDIQCNVITAYLAIFRRGLRSIPRQRCRYSSGSADMESAALPFAQYGALYAWLSCRWLTRSGDVSLSHVAVRPLTKPWAACGSGSMIASTHNTIMTLGAAKANGTG